MPRFLTLLATALLCCGFQQSEDVPPLPATSCDAIEEWALTIRDDEHAIINITYQDREHDLLIPRPASFRRDCGADCEPSEAFSNLVMQVSPMSHYYWLPELMISASRCFTSDTAITRLEDGRFATIEASAMIDNTQVDFTWAEDSCGFSQTVEVARFNGCGSIRATRMEAHGR